MLGLPLPSQQHEHTDGRRADHRTGAGRPLFAVRGPAGATLMLSMLSFPEPVRRKTPPLLLVIAALLVVPAATSAQEVGPRVIAGNDAQPGDHPHQILLQINGNFACGGSILDATHIVTAAHCVVDIAGQPSFYPEVEDPDNFSFLHGGVDRDTDGVLGPDGDDLTPGPAIQSVSVDRRYLRSMNSSEADSAVLTLSAPLTFGGANTKPIPLATAAEVAGESQGTVSGWGATDPDGADSAAEILQEADVPFVSDQECGETYPNDFTEPLMVCAGGFAPEPNPPTQDTCQGDSGGPLSVRVGAELKLAGLTSFGKGCGRFPGVYTEVTEAGTRAFLDDDSQVAPPSTSAGPTISGTPRVGAQVTCNPPAVTGATATQFFWFVLTGTQANQLETNSQTITVPASAQGGRLICDARLENDGGFFYSEAAFASAFGPITAAPAGGGSGTGAGSGTDTTPAFSLLADVGFAGFPGRRTSLRGVLRRGLAGRISCDTDCSFRASLVLPRASARKARLRGRTVVVARVSSSDSAGGSGRRVRFRFKRGVARKLRRLTRGTALELRVTATDSRGTRRSEKKKLRLRR